MEGSYRIRNGDAEKQDEMLEWLPGARCGGQLFSYPLEDLIVRLWMVDLMSRALV